MFDNNKKSSQYFLWGGVAIIVLGFVLILRSFLGPLSEKPLGVNSLPPISFDQTAFQEIEGFDLTQFTPIAFPQGPIGKEDPFSVSSDKE